MKNKNYQAILVTLATLLMLLPICLSHEAFIMVYSILFFSNADNPIRLGACLLILGGYSISVSIITLRIWSIILEKRYMFALGLLAVPFVVNWTIYFVGKFYWKVG